MELSERILNARQRAGLSQRKLGESVGVTEQVVSEWESGTTTPDTATISALCKALHISADYLLLGKEENTQSESKQESAHQESEKQKSASQAEPLSVCPACGKSIVGNTCPHCLYSPTAHYDDGKRYAVILSFYGFNHYEERLAKYLGLSKEDAKQLCNQIKDYSGETNPKVGKRNLCREPALWIAGHIQYQSRVTIVEDAGESEAELIQKSSALPLPDPIEEPKEPLSAGMVVVIVICVMIGLPLLESLLSAF